MEDGEQGDEAYLKTYNSENDSEIESEVESDNMYPPIWGICLTKLKVKDHAIWGIPKWIINGTQYIGPQAD